MVITRLPVNALRSAVYHSIKQHKAVKNDDAEHLAKPSCADMYEGILSWSMIDINSIDYP